MGGPAGVLGMFEKGTSWVRKVMTALEAERRRRETRRLAREVMPGRRRATITRRWLEAELAARAAVRSGVRADDYLRARLARYATALPLPLDSLGVSVGFDNGEPVIRARSHAVPAAQPQTETTRTTRELQEARTEVVLLAERVTAARGHLDALFHSVSEDLADGKLASDPGLLEASPEQRGRPLVPPLAPQLLLGGLSMALLASAAFRMAAPAFSLAGLSPEALAADLARDAASTVSALLFGIGAAVAVFAFLNVAAERGREILLGTHPVRKPVVLGLAGGAALALSAVVSFSAVEPGLLAGPLLLLTVPLGAVFLARLAGRFAAGRAEALASALEWDRTQARNAGERARRSESISRIEAALSLAAREHAVADQRLRILEQRAAEEALQADAHAARVALSGYRLAESLAAALELDRYAFLRRAAALAAGAADVRLLRSRRSPVDPPTVRGPLEAAG